MSTAISVSWSTACGPPAEAPSTWLIFHHVMVDFHPPPPKLHFVDTGLLASLAGLDAEALRRDRALVGPILESFVAAELTKQLGWSTARPALHHFRTHGGQEVDLVLEDSRGRVVGIEVKASATVTSSDLAGLRALAEIAGKAFVQGIVLHLGASQVSFGPGLTACPLEMLWS